jgi:hypothetical protein
MKRPNLLNGLIELDQLTQQAPRASFNLVTIQLI